MTVSGIFVPIIAIFSRENCTDILRKFRHLDPLTKFIYLIEFYSVFWTDEEFCQKSNPSSIFPVLLGFDGHYRDTRNSEVLELVQESQVAIVCPHNIQTLQP